MGYTLGMKKVYSVFTPVSNGDFAIVLARLNSFPTREEAERRIAQRLKDHPQQFYIIEGYEA